MALSTSEKYEQRKIDNLIEYLRLYSQKGQPIDYEIIVDGFKAVRRTSDPDMFTMFENFVSADTRNIEVLLFSGTSNNNDKRIFTFVDAPKEALSGIDVKAQIEEGVQQGVQQRMDKNEFATLRKENEDLKKHILDLECEVEELEKYNARIEARQSPLNNFLGDIGATLVESFIKRNPKLMSSIPGGESLAGLLSSDKTQEDPGPDAQVSFKAKDAESETSLSQDQRSAIEFVEQLKTRFSKDEFDKVMIILETLASDKSKIDLIIGHVNIKHTTV